jgi:predicted phage terminase large subunit-like protein
LRTRRNDLAKTPTIVIATRWHRDDLIGRILQEADEGEWLEIRIPAIARENDPLGREVGESINPDRLPIKSLERERRLMGPRFDSLYQQDPIDEAGSMFDIDKIDRVLATPIEAHRVRFWDRAASVGAGDYTVGVLMAYDKEGVIWIEDIIRDRISKDAVRKRMKDTLVDDLERYGKNPAWSFKTYFEREPAGDGKTAAEDIIRDMAPYPIYSDRASDNKTARSAGFAVAVNASNVKMKIAPWNREFVDELARFVAGIDNKQDDQVDAASGAYNKLVIDNAIVTVR